MALKERKMRSKFHHEEIYRGKNLLKTLESFPIFVCGAGAIGSNLVDNLTRQGFSNLSVLDMDRIESHNINTQIWAENDIGSLKADCLKNKVFRNTSIEINAISKELNDGNVVKFLRKQSLVVDAFDNSKSRQIIRDECSRSRLACVHAGLYADYGEIIWNEKYKVPQDVTGDVCDYPLARNLIMLVVATLSEVILKYVFDGKKQDCYITLKDLKIS